MSASTVGDGRLTMGGHGGGGYVDVALAAAHAARMCGGGGVEGGCGPVLTTDDVTTDILTTDVNALGLEAK